MKRIRATGVMLVFTIALIGCVTANQNGAPTSNTSSGKSDNVLDDSLDFIIDSSLVTSGELAVQGTDGNIYIVKANSSTISLSPKSGEGDADSVLLHPTWSPDGWLSYVEAIRGAPGFSLWAYQPNLGQTVEMYTAPSKSYVHGSWSPNSCETTNLCRFAFLTDDPGGIALHLATQTGAPGSEFSESILGVDQPYYYSWAVDGKSLLWHQGVNDIVEFDIENNQRSKLAGTAGQFQAPAYSPTDTRSAYVSHDGKRHQLVIRDTHGRETIARSSDEGLLFVWSPDGKFVASAEGNFPLRNLSVVQADTLITTALEPVGSIVSFFWSPDSTKIALFVLETPSDALPEANDTGLVNVSEPLRVQEDAILSVYLVTLGENSGGPTKLAGFYPTPDEFYILRYFDQYAQSHRKWSPDSKYIALSRVTVKGNETVGEVILINTTDVNAEATAIMPGMQAVYSLHP